MFVLQNMAPSYPQYNNGSKAFLKSHLNTSTTQVSFRFFQFVTLQNPILIASIIWTVHQRKSCCHCTFRKREQSFQIESLYCKIKQPTIMGPKGSLKSHLSSYIKVYSLCNVDEFQKSLSYVENGFHTYFMQVFQKYSRD